MSRKKRLAAGLLAGITVVGGFNADSAVIARAEASSAVGNLQGVGSTKIINGSIHYKNTQNILLSVEEGCYVTTLDGYKLLKDDQERLKNSETIAEVMNRLGVTGYSNGGSVNLGGLGDGQSIAVFKDLEGTYDSFVLVDDSPQVSVEVKETENFVKSGSYYATNGNKIPFEVTVNKKSDVAVVDPVTVTFKVGTVEVKKELEVGTHLVEVDLPESQGGALGVEYTVKDSESTVILSGSQSIEVKKSNGSVPNISASNGVYSYSIPENPISSGKGVVGLVKKGVSLEENLTEKNGVLVPESAIILEEFNFDVSNPLNVTNKALPENIESGEYLLFVAVGSKVGNGSVGSALVSIDKEDPVVSAVVTSSNGTHDDVSYFKENPSVTYKVSDDVGIETAGVYFISNGAEVLVSDLTSKLEGSITLEPKSENGKYIIKAVDTSGKTSSADIISTPFVVDSTSPVIKSFEVSQEKSSAGSVYGGYFKKSADSVVVMKLETEDDIGFVTKVFANGVEIQPDGVFYAVDPSMVSSSDKLVLEAVVTDYAGNESKKTLELVEDGEAPVVTEKQNKNIIVKDGVLYSNKPVEYTLNATDSKSGVKGFVVDGVFKANGSKEVISESTSSLPSVKVVDNLDNEVEIPFWRLVSKEEFSSVNINSEKPSVEFVNVETPTGYLKDVEKISVKVKTKSLFGWLIIKDNTGKTLVSRAVANDGVYDVPVKNGLNVLNVNIKDIVGNTTDSVSNVLVDNESPKIETSVNGEFKVKNDVVYAKDKLTIKINSSDEESGVEKILVVRGSVEEEIQGGTLEITSVKDPVSFKVVDKVGHETVKTLEEVLGVSNVKGYVFDGVAPVINTNFREPDVIINGKNLFNRDFEVKASVEESDETLESFELFDNGVLVASLDKNNANYKITEEGSHAIKLVAKDKSGNESSKEYSFTLDKTAPTGLSASTAVKVADEEHGVYVKGKFGVVLSSNDSQTGVKGYWINGVFQESASFEAEEGSYTIQVEDNAGNKSEPVNLNTLTGWKSNNIFIDSGSPVIKFESLGGKWLGSDFSNSVVFEDELGIRSYIVKINGMEVANKVLKAGEKVDKFEFNTSSVPVPENGRYDVNFEVSDWSGNVAEMNDYFFIDRTAPTITNFEFISNGYLEGNTLNGANEYGFFFKDGAVVRIHAKDDGVSSGIKGLLVKVGNQPEVSVDVNGGFADVEIPANFKGWVSAKAVDGVGHESESAVPSGVVTEDANYSITNNFLDLVLPSTNMKDVNGNPLYNSDITVGVIARNPFSGLRSVQVNNVVESYDIRGNSSNEFNSKTGKSINLVTSAEGAYQLTGNSNGITVSGALTDRTGQGASVSRIVSIDKDAPVIGVSFDSSKGNGVFNQTRIATITVKERNFSPDLVKFSGNLGRLSGWRETADGWVTSMVFSEDGEYGFSVSAEDLAGNKSQTVTTESFKIDKTSPVIDVSFNNNNPSNGKYYSSGRAATITVREKNFDPSLIRIEGGSVGGWSQSGEVHSAVVSFQNDGVYQLKVSGEDLGGNTGNPFDSGEFVVDSTKPELDVSGVQSGMGYFKDFGFSVKYSDTNLDNYKTFVTLRGREKGIINIGSLDGFVDYFNSSTDDSMDDVYELTAHIVDLAGNVSEEVVNFSVNRGGSVFTFLNEDYNGKYLKSVDNIVITEMSVEEIEESSVQILLGDKVIKIPNDKVKVSKSGGEGSKWVYTYEMDKSLFEEEGTYRIQVMTSSKTGKQNSSVSQEYVFVVDKTPPKVTIGGISENKSYKTNKKRVSLNIDDISGVEFVKVLVDGEEVEVYWNDGIAYFDISEKDSAQNVSVTVIDKAGNESIVNVNGVFVNSSWVVQLVRTIWFWLGLVGFVGVVSWMFLLLFKRRKEEEEQQKSIKEMVSTTGSSTGSSETDETVSLGGKDEE